MHSKGYEDKSESTAKATSSLKTSSKTPSTQSHPRLSHGYRTLPHVLAPLKINHRMLQTLKVCAPTDLNILRTSLIARPALTRTIPPLLIAPTKTERLYISEEIGLAEPLPGQHHHVFWLQLDL